MLIKIAILNEYCDHDDKIINMTQEYVIYSLLNSCFVNQSQNQQRTMYYSSLHNNNNNMLIPIVDYLDLHYAAMRKCLLVPTRSKYIFLTYITIFQANLIACTKISHS